MTTAGLLGTANYEVQITTRGGGQKLGVMDWDSIGYSRPLDNTGDASAKWFAGDAAFPNFLWDVEPWKHDLVLLRAGEPDPVFVGPVRNVVYEDGEVQITAKDPTAWFEKRRIYTDTEYNDVNLAYIYGRLCAEALSRDPSPNLQIITAPCGLLGTRVTRAAERALAADLLRELPGPASTGPSSAAAS